MLQSLIILYNRDLEKLKEELLTYNNEQNVWKNDGNISNCAGNLALHLIGNLNHFIGAMLGHTGYIRQRELEFSKKDVPVSEIITMIDATKQMLQKTLNSLTTQDLQKEYRRNPFENYMTTEYFLLHLKSHLAYHLGQISYHRRLLD